MVYNPVDVFGLTCPMGGAFFVCEDCDVHFLGCCASDPGEDGSGWPKYCPDEDVRYSSFRKERGANITEQECLDTKGDWYTCFDLDKPFLGCCTSNACHTGCPAEDVVGAKLSSNPKSAAPFRKSQTTQTATSTSSTSTSSTSSTNSRRPTTSSTVDSSKVSTTSGTSAGPTTTSETKATDPASSSASGSGSPGLSKGATAGVSVGATLVLLLLAAAVLFFARRTWRKRRGVVFRGSEPPASGAMVLPTSVPYVSRYSTHTVQPPSHSHSQSQSQSQSQSPSLSLNNGQRPVLYIVNGSSRPSSVSSNHSNNVAGPSPSSGQNSWYGVGAAPSTARRDVDHYQNQPLNRHSERLAELDGAGMPIPEMPVTSPAQPRTPVVYRPYRPPPQVSSRDY